MSKIKNIFDPQNQLDSKDKPDIDFSQNSQQPIDLSDLRSQRIVSLQPQSVEANMFKILRAKILRQLRTNQWNSFGITSPGKGAGKSMIAANLAVTIAMDVNQSVLLIDMDLLNPKVSWYFNLNVKNVLKDCLTTSTPLAEVLINPGIDRLKIIPSKGRSHHTSELISSPKMKDLITEIKNNLEAKIIIFDLPPVLIADDVLASIDYYDALLFVIEEGGSSAEEIRKSLQMVADKPFLGTLLNKSDHLAKYDDYYQY